MSRYLASLIALPLFVFTTTAHAQSESALRKSDLVRYLTGTTYSKSEIAAIVRRNCLAFVPSARDREDLKQLGANDAILREIDRCVNNNNKASSSESSDNPSRPVAPAPASPPTLTVINGLASAMSGNVAYITVDLARGDTPMPGARLMLKGATNIPGGAQADPVAITDAKGRATFTVPAGTHAGTYHMTVVTSDGSPLEGTTAVSLSTMPAGASLATVNPTAIAIGAGARGARELSVAVNDAFGNPVSKATVQVRPYPARSGVGTLTQSTNDAGVAKFSIQTQPLQAGDSLVVSVGDRAVASVRVTAAEQVTALLLEAERQLAIGRSGAIAAYDSVLSVDPANTRALLGRGYAESAEGKFDAANKDFATALREGEDVSGAHTGLGYTALRRGDLVGAAQHFQEALHSAAGDPAASTGLAYAELWRIDSRQAPHRADALSSPRPTSYPARAADDLRTGIASFAARNTQAAERSLTSAASAAPNWPDVFYTRALVYQAEGRSDAAATDFRKYLDLRPNAVDRADVANRIKALSRSPATAFALGAIPGGGQFYTQQPVLGVIVLAGVAGGTAWALHSTTSTEIRTFTDPFGRVDTFTVNVSKRKNLGAGLAVAGGVLLVGAIEAALHVSSARGDPYPPSSTPNGSGAAGGTGALLTSPRLEPMLGVDPVSGAPRWGLALRLGFR
ncbi:MAG TPA: tetratricopeptide repeat protein [Candidatus Eisenbacteria bacterium]|nr:tetratricopeptide repeat protein [Candidatus Eisenbacteria bacterium]